MARTVWRELVCGALLVAAVACGGKDVRNGGSSASSASGTTDTGGTASNEAGGTQNDPAGTTSQPEGGEPGVAVGGTFAIGGEAATPGRCDPMSRDEAPGIPVFNRDEPSNPECQLQSLDELIAQAQLLVPELKAVNTLYEPDPDRGGDGSFIYAFQLDDGTFALAFQLGSGDCPSGCINHEYWYFVTSDACQPLQVGHYQPNSAACTPGEAPMWGIPGAPPPGTGCGGVTDPAYMIGDYDLVACGEEQPCAAAGKSLPARALPKTIRISIDQSRQLAIGKVTLHGTGEPLLDERAFDATFTGRSFAVEVHGPLSPACAQNYSLSFHYDFDGVGPRSLSLDFERLNTCSGNAGASCKGSVRSDFGPAHAVTER
jgi:hypothetical protein